MHRLSFTHTLHSQAAGEQVSRARVRPAPPLVPVPGVGTEGFGSLPAGLFNLRAEGNLTATAPLFDSQVTHSCPFFFPGRRAINGRLYY